MNSLYYTLKLYLYTRVTLKSKEIRELFSLFRKLENPIVEIIYNFLKLEHVYHATSLSCKKNIKFHIYVLKMIFEVIFSI